MDNCGVTRTILQRPRPPRSGLGVPRDHDQDPGTSALGADVEKCDEQYRVVATVEQCEVQIQTQQEKVQTFREPRDGVKCTDEYHGLDHGC